MLTTQSRRLVWRSSFFLLFVLAPPLDLFRFDLIQNHLVVFGHPWTLGITGSQTMDTSAGQLTWNIFTRLFLPLGLIVGGGIYVSWKWGRLYCGWLCPHFSVVEMINALMRRASGKPSIWEKKKLPEHQKDGKNIEPEKRWWFATLITIFLFSFLWAVVFLTYLLPPAEIYSNLFSFSLTRNQSLFIGVATTLLIIEFTFARHLFCRFGCAIGVFQSLVWMGNRKAMVVSFDRKSAKKCSDCDNSCEHACPMRLKPRGTKRHMFTCTQCMQCVESCERVQKNVTQSGRQVSLPLLKMLEGNCALDTSARDFGNKPEVPEACYDLETKGKRGCSE